MKSLAARPIRLALIDHLATFTKSLAIYPPTNNRVVANLDQVMEAFGQIQAKGKPRPVRALFGGQHLRIDGEEHEIVEGTQTKWLHERIDRTALVGFEISPTLQRSSVVSFCRLLIDNHSNFDAHSTFETMWRAAPDDFLPIERRFDGDFSGVLNDLDLDGSAAEPNYLAKALASEESIQGRLLALQMALDHDQVGPQLSIDMLDHISRLLPADVMTDLPRVIEMTNRMIEEVTERVQEPVEAEAANHEDRQLERMLSTIAQNLFARNDATLEAVEPKELQREQPPKQSGKGHKGDDAITDDVDQMLGEFDRLPNFDPQIALFRAEDTYAEQVGVFLHYLLQDEDVLDYELLKQHVLGLLRSETPSVFEVLNEYVDLLASPQGRQSIRSERLTQTLREAGLSHMLLERGVVSADSVREFFPEDFGYYVDAVDLEQPEAVEELARICLDLGHDLIVGNGARLVRNQQLLAHGRIEKLLQTGHPELAGLAQVALEHGNDETRQLVIDYLRSQDLERKDACLLMIGERLDYFPREYLGGLLDPDLPGDRRKEGKLRNWVSILLCRYIRSEENPEDRRVYAIRMLIDFWTDDAAEVLQTLVRQPLIGRSPVPASVRKASKEILVAMGAD